VFGGRLVQYLIQGSLVGWWCGSKKSHVLVGFPSKIEFTPTFQTHSRSEKKGGGKMMMDRWAAYETRWSRGKRRRVDGVNRWSRLSPSIVYLILDGCLLEDVRQLDATCRAMRAVVQAYIRLTNRPSMLHDRLLPLSSPFRDAFRMDDIKLSIRNTPFSKLFRAEKRWIWDNSERGRYRCSICHVPFTDMTDVQVFTCDAPYDVECPMRVCHRCVQDRKTTEGSDFLRCTSSRKDGTRCHLATCWEHAPADEDNEGDDSGGAVCAVCETWKCCDHEDDFDKDDDGIKRDRAWCVAKKCRQVICTKCLPRALERNLGACRGCRGMVCSARCLDSYYIHHCDKCKKWACKACANMGHVCTKE
jgi:hypothetical protein